MTFGPLGLSGVSQFVNQKPFVQLGSVVLNLDYEFLPGIVFVLHIFGDVLTIFDVTALFLGRTFSKRTARVRERFVQILPWAACKGGREKTN